MPEFTIANSDFELMREFESLRRQACGAPIGEEDQTPAEAAEAEGLTVIRAIHGGTNVPRTPVLAKDPRGSLYVVNDLDGPWCIQISEKEAK